MMGIRACMLQHKEPRPRGNEKKAAGGWRGGDDEGGSSGEDEVRVGFVRKCELLRRAHENGHGCLPGGVSVAGGCSGLTYAGNAVRFLCLLFFFVEPHFFWFSRGFCLWLPLR